MKKLLMISALIISPVLMSSNSISASPSKIIETPNMMSYDDFSCTVTLHAKLEAGGNWAFVSAGVEGSIKFTSTKETCAAAVKDIKGGMAAIL